MIHASAKTLRQMLLTSLNLTDAASGLSPNVNELLRGGLDRVRLDIAGRSIDCASPSLHFTSRQGRRARFPFFELDGRKGKTFTGFDVKHETRELFPRVFIIMPLFPNRELLR
ncbi:hypothetical protein GGR50DRAFT_8601 [Xylaria sp. CBS 124048]|nr:hypothetical protein GGR50DRAFT_8601 [Xylaria sp. CBS 124048]